SIDEIALRRRIDSFKILIAEGDPHHLLGLTPEASREELHDAYYKLAKDFHPDRHQLASKELRTEIDEIFAQITRAYETLRNQMLMPAPLASLQTQAAQPATTSPAQVTTSPAQTTTAPAQATAPVQAAPPGPSFHFSDTGPLVLPSEPVAPS